MARKKRDPKKTALVQAILNEYQPENVEDMQDALKDIFGSMFEAMLKGEMNDHLGYESNDRQEKEDENRRSGYSSKTLKTSFGNVSIAISRDRDSSFEPKVVPKRTTNVSGIEDKVLSMYAKGMSQRGQSNLPGCDRSTLHGTFDPKLCEIRSQQEL